MIYKNGKDVLPPSLLKELQSYIQGELVYIPKLQNKRAGWGEKSGTRIMIARRNEEIYQSYTSGSSVAELERQFHLSTESIRKIIVKLRGTNKFQYTDREKEIARADN
ncbi:CD3324 family protein [Paenibacillus spongiae]|uniref:Mor transcription activator domain-containing protein n=1 Tax=Paenibacillus spongiae TaxID=2909671 RepID=A0ABY5SHF6_9BACL|nr:CD3324 family protein [Paenibacillus spongiae]UVI32125.1 hypothetical protein L1F29_10035 [Paenibacillus spongiae]